MVKAPVAGGVKTRLARDIGPVAATAFYRHASATVIARLAVAPQWETVLAPAGYGQPRVPGWPVRLARVVQARADLGTRMQRLLEVGAPGPVVVIGSDIPGVTPAHIRKAFRLLGAHDAVFGPAEDGGFWLVGYRRRPRLPGPFAGVRWSSAETLQDTLQNLKGWRVAMADTLGDVDAVADLRRRGSTAGRRVPPLRPARAPQIVPASRPA